MSRYILITLHDLLFFDTSVNSIVNCTYGDVRLVGGSTEYEGRLEVCINGVWGTVCDNEWEIVMVYTGCKIKLFKHVIMNRWPS